MSDKTQQPGHPIDRHVGARMRMRRVAMRLSEAAFARVLIAVYLATGATFLIAAAA